MGKQTWQFQKGNKSTGKEGCFRVGVLSASASQALVGSVLIYAGGQRMDYELTLLFRNALSRDAFQGRLPGTSHHQASRQCPCQPSPHLCDACVFVCFSFVLFVLFFLFVLFVLFVAGDCAQGPLPPSFVLLPFILSFSSSSFLLLFHARPPPPSHPSVPPVCTYPLEIALEQRQTQGLSLWGGEEH